MPLIKAPNLPTSATPFSMSDIENQARSMLLRARQQADALLAAAQAEADRLRQEAHAAGLEEGRADGHKRGREEGFKAGRDQAFAEQKAALAAAVQALAQSCRQLDASRRDLQAQAVNDVIQLAIAIAERATRRLGAIDATGAIASVAEALKLVGRQSDVRIEIHPSQKAAIQSALPSLGVQWPGLDHVQLVEDPSIEPGGCRIRTARGMVDATLGEQLARIVADLLPEATPEGAAS